MSVYVTDRLVKKTIYERSHMSDLIDSLSAQGPARCSHGNGEERRNCASRSVDTGNETSAHRHER